MEGDNATYQEEVIVFERATRTVRGQLLKTANGYLHNAEEAEDAVQETLMRCWVARHRLHHIEEMPAFAMRIVKNLCIEQLRGKKEISDYVTNDHIAPADILMMHREQHEWMMTCLRQLPVGARSVLQMKGIDGLSYQEMATLLGTTEATVRAKVAKARKQLWQIYNRRK